MLADSNGSEALGAFGVTGFPGFVAVGADGKVVERRTGEIGVDGYRRRITAAGG